MALTELAHERFYTISHDTDEGWLYVNWTGYQTVDSVKQGCNTMLDLMVAHQALRILNDNTNVLGIWSGASEWAGTNWFPRMKQAGMQRFAWVYSPSRFSQISTDATMNLVDAEATGIAVFYNIDDAKQWLRAG